MDAIKYKILSGETDFEPLAIQVFNYQAINNLIYRDFISSLKINPQQIKSIDKIPFLPIGFFKTHDVICRDLPVKKIFTSSGTTGAETSRHLIPNPDFYKQVFIKAFEKFYGDVKTYCVIALLPSYLEREGSSLIFMADELIKESHHEKSGFYLHNYEDLSNLLNDLEKRNQKILLLGVTYALLDLAEQFPKELKNTIIMETGGMKGKRKEMIRSEIHDTLKAAFSVNTIHSEYGMTELMSQAYSKGEGLFYCPAWMKVFIKDINDPFGENQFLKSGAVHIIDLANVDSCSFIASQDLGKSYVDGSFEILGRFDNSDLRGCNLLL